MTPSSLRTVLLASALAGALMLPACKNNSAPVPPDAGAPDAGSPDAGPPDGGSPDAGTPDAGSPDAGSPDAGAPDAGSPDAGSPDAGAPDAGPLAIQRLPAVVNRVDLVLAVDNSASMADKQYVLSLAIPELVGSLVNPACISDSTHQPIASGQPAEGLAACPAGSSRLFPPVTDLHVGLVSSSLGTFGADGCPDTAPAICPGANSTSNDDHGHLVTRTNACGTTDVPTYQSEGFIAWDPKMRLTPAGTSSQSELTSAVTNLVIGDGQLGCGFESQNESWYRFLVDPTPYQSIALVNNQVRTFGVDQALLAQRKAFLRPDSLLLIVVVSDETDTSIKEYSSYPLFAAPELHLPHPSAKCGFGTANPTPTDPCCYSCGQTPPAGCTADPACSSSPSYTSADENASIRAFGLTSHKSRYGIEFFYPPGRYVNALTSPTVLDVNGASVANPIYSNLDPTSFHGAVRDPSRVFYSPIAGVPWQLIARQLSGTPDLVNGVSALDATQVGGFKTGAELSLSDASGNPFWSDIAGDPESYVAPRSPFMQESTVPRSGTDPITGAAISPTTTANGSGSQSGGGLLNDHERTLDNPPGDIEYACAMELPAGHTRDCTTGVACDCPSTAGTATDNPLCNGTAQVKAKAYPGLKQLAIAHGLGAQGLPASICWDQVTDATSTSYGLRPAVRSILSGVEHPLQQNVCIARALTPNASDQVACAVVEATNVGTGACNCAAGQGRAPLTAAEMPIETAAKADPGYAAGQWNCFCEIPQLATAAAADCQTTPSSTTNGWCYVDAAMGAQQQALASVCPAAEPHRIRFVGVGTPVPDSTLFLGCSP